MRKLKRLIVLLLASSLMLSGCAMATLDKLYCLPKRSEEYENLQAVIDKAMSGLTYCAPMYGENRLVHQTADLDGDGVDEYLVFARDESEKPLKVLIFTQLASGYVLMDTIEGYGFAFDFVTYAQMDDKPGLELILGRQLTDQVMQAVSVYRFVSGYARQLISTGYSEVATTDLDRDGTSELFLLTPGTSEKSFGTAKLIHYLDGEMQRSPEIQLSTPMSGFKMLHIGSLQSGDPALYITSSPDAQKLVTDVLTMDRLDLQLLMKGITVANIDNYYVYPADMDADGVLELPRLIPLENFKDNDSQQHMIQWYTLDADKKETVKMYTYHSYTQNWYLQLDENTISQLAVSQTEDGCTFYYQGEKMFSILTLMDADRVEQSQLPGRSVLYSSDTVIYVAIIENSDFQKSIEQELIARFHPIRVDLNTEED